MPLLGYHQSPLRKHLPVRGCRSLQRLESHQEPSDHWLRPMRYILRGDSLLSRALLQNLIWLSSRLLRIGRGANVLLSMRPTILDTADALPATKAERADRRSRDAPD